MKKLIGTNNWPKISEVGERAAKSAFFILAHAEDTSSIAHYLPLIKQYCENGEAAWMQYAMLYDRLQVSKGLPQHFGTQYKPPKNPEDKLELFPLEDVDMVNPWRIALGIEPIDE